MPTRSSGPRRCFPTAAAPSSVAVSYPTRGAPTTGAQNSPETRNAQLQRSWPRWLEPTAASPTTRSQGKSSTRTTLSGAVLAAPLFFLHPPRRNENTMYTNAQVALLAAASHDTKEERIVQRAEVFRIWLDKQSQAAVAEFAWSQGLRMPEEDEATTTPGSESPGAHY